MSNPMFSGAACERSLEKIAGGDISALGVIYERLGRQIIALSAAILRDHSYAEDVLHETFVKIIENIHTYRKSGNAKTWIMSVARNTALDMQKRRRRDANIEDAGDLPDELDLTGVILESVALERALQSLCETDRQIVVLKSMAGLSHRAIGEMLGLSEDAAQKRYRRALDRLGCLLK